MAVMAEDDAITVPLTVDEPARTRADSADTCGRDHVDLEAGGYGTVRVAPLLKGAILAALVVQSTLYALVRSYSRSTL